MQKEDPKTCKLVRGTLDAWLAYISAAEHFYGVKFAEQ